MPDWLWRRRDTPAQRLGLAPLLLAEGPYRLGAWFHRTVYRLGLLPRTRLEARVVSVGNLAVGGSGKTPVAGWLARELAARGHRVAILSRGVGGDRVREVNVVSDGERIFCSAVDVGDEALMLASRSPRIPVLAGRNRAALGRRAEAQFGVDLVVVDDGFQHHRLRRDVDLVCVEAGLGLGNGHVLPRGPLRESRGVLRFADAIVLTRVADAGSGNDPLRGAVPRLPRFRLAMRATGLRRHGRSGGLFGKSRLSAEALQGKRIGIVVGLARPDGFEAKLVALGAEVAQRRVFADHHAYAPADVQDRERDLLWITTAKDAVKIPASWLGKLPLWVFEEAVADLDGGALVDFVCTRLSTPSPEPHREPRSAA